MQFAALIKKFLPIAQFQPMTAISAGKSAAVELIKPPEASIQSSNIVELPVGHPGFSTIDPPHFGQSDSSPEPVTAGPQSAITGLKDAPELLKFFAQPYFNFGRHHGSKYRSDEALDSGLNDLIGGFQSILADLIERRQTLDNRIQIEILGLENYSESVTNQLRLRSEQLQTEIANLRNQTDLSEQHKGWIIAPLNEYRLGFDRGVREALAFDLLKI